MNNGPLCADFAAIVRAHPDGVLVITDNARIVFSNAVAMGLLCRLSDAFGHIPGVLDIPAGHTTRVSLLELTGEEVVLQVRSHRVEWGGGRARAPSR
jgi:PAS domain-containing protein